MYFVCECPHHSLNQPHDSLQHDDNWWFLNTKADTEHHLDNNAILFCVGLRFGLYLDAGSRTCAGFPGSLDHEAQDVAWMASIGVDYLWLDGCNLNATLMPEKYELWSSLLNASGREIPWEVSWPAYTWHRASGTTAGADPFNQDLWQHSASVGHEVRVYNDNRADFTYILDIAAFAHEAGLARFHQPGGMMFMDMLEVGVDSLTFLESRAHFGLWVLLAQPLHLALDIRNSSIFTQDYVDMVTNQEVIAASQDPLVKMG